MLRQARPNRSAISSFRWPSSLHWAMLRRRSSSSTRIKRWYSSAAIASTSGVAASPTISLLEQALVVDHFPDGDGGQQLPEFLTIDHGDELASGGALVQTT